MYQISKRLTIAGAFLGLACGFLLTQQPTKAATTPQAATPTTQVVKADSNVIDQGIDGTCQWEEVQEGDDVVLNVHAGKLDSNCNFYKLPVNSNQIVIDPGVIAPKNCMHLFENQRASEIDGLNNLGTSHVTNMSEMFFLVLT